MVDIRGISFSLEDEELEDLPLSVLQELKFAGAKRHQVILEVLTENGGAASLDQLLVRYWRKTELEVTRQQMVATLHRMTRKKSIERIAGQQGVYAITERKNGPFVSLTAATATQSGRIGDNSKVEA